MIDLDQVVARRANEQVATVRLRGYHEPDSWAIAGEEPPKPKPLPRVCKAPGCGRPARTTGYCHRCGRRLARGLPLEWDPSEPGRRPAPASLGTEADHGRSAAPPPSRRAPSAPNSRTFTHQQEG